MLSLKLRFSGRETFRQILTLVGWGTARIEFALKFGRGGLRKGPATNFFCTHDAIVSVTEAPCKIACFEFFTQQEPSLFIWNDGPPCWRYSRHLFALFASDLSKRGNVSLTARLRLSWLTLVSGFTGRSLKGKFSQKASEPFPP